MPNWKDELKAEIEDLGTNVDAISPTGKEFRELIALILELIDHIPDEKVPLPFFDWEPKK
jgi:hypothetical protein